MLNTEGRQELVLQQAYNQAEDLRQTSRQAHSIHWFKQIAVMSNPLRPSQRLARSFEVALETLQRPLAVATVTQDAAESTLLSANKAFARVNGWSKKDLQGKRLADCDSALLLAKKASIDTTRMGV